MNEFEQLLAGGDLRKIGNSNVVVKLIHNQNDFDKLFTLLFHANRLIVMRAADAIEKISIHSPQYLNKYKQEIFSISETVKNNAIDILILMHHEHKFLEKSEFKKFVLHPQLPVMTLQPL